PAASAPGVLLSPVMRCSSRPACGEIRAVTRSWLVGSRLGEYGCGFQDLSEFSAEPCSRRAVNHVVVDGEGEIQDVPHLDLSVEEARLRADTADDVKQEQRRLQKVRGLGWRYGVRNRHAWLMACCAPIVLCGLAAAISPAFHCHWPTRPSIRSRSRSAWPQWRAYSSIM